jgi:cell division protein FtsW
MILLAFGVVMVFSASWASSYLGENRDSYFYLKRELIFASAGLVLMFLMARFDYTRLRRIAPFLMIVSLGLLLLVFLPGAGASAKGARRWLDFGLLSFQPSELAKLAVILYVAAVMYARRQLLTSLREMFLPLLLMPVLACGLVLIEPDMGTAITICVTLVGMLIMGGVRLRLLTLPALVGGLVAALSVLVSPHQAARITAFLDPWKDAQGSGYQVIQSWVALASGGLLGVGIGNSVQKYDWLPEHHTDMILSIIGEELGLAGVLAVLAAFATFAFIGYRIALKCCDPFGKYLAAGITTLMVSQAAVNFCAVTGMLPLTGVPLPIISYGGTSLVVILTSIGILLNVAINPRSKIAAPGKRKFKAIEGGNRGRRHRRALGASAGSRRRAQA